MPFALVLPERFQHFLQAIELDLIHQAQLLAQPTVWKTIGMKPHQVGLG